MKELFKMNQLPIPNRKNLRRQAKLAKSFMVLIKHKLQRDQVCRGHLFRKLQALVFDPEDLKKPGGTKHIVYSLGFLFNFEVATVSTHSVGDMAMVVVIELRLMGQFFNVNH